MGLKFTLLLRLESKTSMFGLAKASAAAKPPNKLPNVGLAEASAAAASAAAAASLATASATFQSWHVVGARDRQIREPALRAALEMLQTPMIPCYHY